MKTQTSIAVDKVLAADFGMTEGRRTLDRTPGWFLEHPHYSYEWYRTGKGNPFRHRRGLCLRLSVPERLDLALELLDLSEVQLWTELGWDAEAINLASLKAGHLHLSDEQLSAIATALSLSLDWLRSGNGRMLYKKRASLIKEALFVRKNPRLFRERERIIFLTPSPASHTSSLSLRRPSADSIPPRRPARRA